MSLPGSTEDLVGKDGRFTVLILGSDNRKGIVGERTDTMVVASLNPRTATSRWCRCRETP